MKHTTWSTREQVGPIVDAATPHYTNRSNLPAHQQKSTTTASQLMDSPPKTMPSPPDDLDYVHTQHVDEFIVVIDSQPTTLVTTPKTSISTPTNPVITPIKTELNDDEEIPCSQRTQAIKVVDKKIDSVVQNTVVSLADKFECFSYYCTVMSRVEELKKSNPLFHMYFDDLDDENALPTCSEREIQP